MPIALLTVPPNQTARFGNAEVQRAIHRFGQLHIGRDGEEHVADAFTATLYSWKS
jgi:hypothetical protein